MRRAAKIDGNQPAIARALRAAGCFVQSMAAIGKGCPDLLAAKGGRWYVIEVKDAIQDSSHRRLTKAELEWVSVAHRFGPVHVVETVEQALQVIA